MPVVVACRLDWGNVLITNSPLIFSVCFLSFFLRVMISTGLILIFWCIESVLVRWILQLWQSASEQCVSEKNDDSSHNYPGEEHCVLFLDSWICKQPSWKELFFLVGSQNPSRSRLPIASAKAKLFCHISNFVRLGWPDFAVSNILAYYRNMPKKKRLSILSSWSHVWSITHIYKVYSPYTKGQN